MKRWLGLPRPPRLVVVSATILVSVWFYGLWFTSSLSYTSRESEIAVWSGAGELGLRVGRHGRQLHEYDLGVWLYQGRNDAANKFLWRSLQPFYLSAHGLSRLEVRTRHSTLLVAILGIHLYRRVRGARRTPVPREAPGVA
jgi:hypothetical protein